MTAKLSSAAALLLVLAVPAQPALAKKHAPKTKASHAQRAATTTTSTSTTTKTASRTSSLTATDPATTVTDPATTVTDPATTVTDPATQIPAPAPNPAQACRAEQDDDGFADVHGGLDFAHFYGTNRNLANAFGKCVSQHAHEHGGEDDDAGSDD